MVRNIAVIGTHWGDEGKGKIVDFDRPGRRGGTVPGGAQRWPYLGRGR